MDRRVSMALNRDLDILKEQAPQMLEHLNFKVRGNTDVGQARATRNVVLTNYYFNH